MTALAPEPVATGDVGAPITHWVCECREDVAVCGADVTGEEWMDDDEDVTCVVCNDLVDLDCPRCGA